MAKFLPSVGVIPSTYVPESCFRDLKHVSQFFRNCLSWDVCLIRAIFFLYFQPDSLIATFYSKIGHGSPTEFVDSKIIFTDFYFFLKKHLAITDRMRQNIDDFREAISGAELFLTAKTGYQFDFFFQK